MNFFFLLASEWMAFFLVPSLNLEEAPSLSSRAVFLFRGAFLSVPLRQRSFFDFLFFPSPNKYSPFQTAMMETFFWDALSPFDLLFPEKIWF